jgi:hypothetical protein
MPDNTSREDDYVARLVAQAPPFTPAQIVRLAGLFADGGDDGNQ